MPTFSLVKVDKHGRSQYRLDGNKNTTIRFGASIFAGAPPATIEVTADNFAAVKEPKKKLTKEERAALPKPTAAEKAKQAKERAERAIKRANKLAAAAEAEVSE